MRYKATSTPSPKNIITPYPIGGDTPGSRIAGQPIATNPAHTVTRNHLPTRRPNDDRMTTGGRSRSYAKTLPRCGLVNVNLAAALLELFRLLRHRGADVGGGERIV